MHKVLLLSAAWLVVCAAQAQAFSPSQGPDTPPIAAEFPTRIGGLAADTLMERSTVSASRRGWTQSAMLASINVIGERLDIMPRPDYMTCAAQSSTRWTCATKTERHRVTVRVYIPHDKPVVITRTFVKTRAGAQIASAWAAQTPKRARTMVSTGLRNARVWNHDNARLRHRVGVDIAFTWQRADKRLSGGGDVNCFHSSDGNLWAATCRYKVRGGYINAAATFRKSNRGRGVLLIGNAVTR